MKLVKTIIKVLVILLVVGAGVFLYATRPVSAPSQNINEAVGAGEQRTPLRSVRGGEPTVYRISQDQSTAQYALDETLRGEDVVVVGTTNQIAGDVTVNFADPGASVIGEILINARTFKTAEPSRDNAVGRFILKAEEPQYEYIKFVPSGVSGLPADVVKGETYNVTVTGALTILDTTKTVSFVGTVVVTDETLTADMSVTIPYADYGVNVPDLPFIAYVEDEVTLTVHAVAERMGE